jgi:Zn-finger nucleic acid-binding protein
MTAPGQVAHLRCVQCSVDLSPLGPEGVLVCAGCGGEFCERSALEAIVEKARLGPAAGQYVRPVLNLTDPIRYLACPVCSELMVRRNYGASSGVVVDVCGRHGVWFDHGELAQVLAFCANGGLEPPSARAAQRSPGTLSAQPETWSATHPAELVGVCVEVLAAFFD